MYGIEISLWTTAPDTLNDNAYLNKEFVMKNHARIYLILLLGLLFCLSACEWLGLSNDEEKPTININSPTNYFSWVTTSATLDLAGTASDNEELKSVKVSVNGGAYVSATGKTSWSLQDLPLAEGENVIVCQAKDKKGNAASDTLWVTRNTDVEFTGVPSFGQTSFFAGQTGFTAVRQTIQASAKAITSVKLVRLTDSLTVAQEVGDLMDNGNLSNSDEISGDGIYSGNCGIYEQNTGSYLYRVVAYTGSKVANYSPLFRINVYEALSSTDIDVLTDTYDQIDDVLNASDATSLEEGKDALKDWFASQAGVASVAEVDGALEITYTSGITSGVIFSETDADGNIITKGGSTTAVRQPPTVPLHKQTRGVNPYAGMTPYVNWNLSKDVDPNAILDKDVLIWAPFESAFGIDMRPSLETIFGNSDLGLNVVSLANQQCTIASLANLAEYGTIIFDTHGKGGEYILTGELMTADNLIEHLLDIIDNKISYHENVTYNNEGEFVLKGTVYSVRSAYIASLAGTLPNSLVFNGSCESSKTLNLANAFLGKGAKAYFGFSKIVSTSFCKAKCDELFQKMAVELKNNGQAFTAGQSDPISHHATYTMNASTNELHYSYDLINGDFEMGNLTGWTRAGDGRVITLLGDYTPTQGSFMGIISTGLGYSTDSGSIAQSFKVPDAVSNLKIKWNFMSEEFMEWVGSQYQDYLTFALKDSAGVEHVLFHETIDSFVGYGLTDVSPPISFGQGDAYGTDWREFVADIVEYRGQIVRLIIRIGDVGDSAYDSACLLDEISIY